MADVHDPCDLQRFVDAQEGVYELALREIREGRKRSHWMWFGFPQIAGLGASGMSRRFAIRSRDEAVAYLQHPVLGSRLHECCEALLAHHGRRAREILGKPDDLKLHSCATLFAQVAEPGSLFAAVLAAFFVGIPDAATASLLGHDV